MLRLHGARWYSPTTGRWQSEDSIRFDGGDWRRFVTAAFGRKSSAGPFSAIECQAYERLGEPVEAASSVKCQADEHLGRRPESKRAIGCQTIMLSDREPGLAQSLKGSDFCSEYFGSQSHFRPRLAASIVANRCVRSADRNSGPRNGYTRPGDVCEASPEMPAFKRSHRAGGHF